MSPYLSQFVGLFSLGHGGLGRQRLVGLGDHAGTHFVLLLVLVLFFGGGMGDRALGAAGLECAGELESLLFMGVLRVRGEGTQATGVSGGLTRRRGGVAFWEISEAAVRTIWSLRDQPSVSTAGMRTFSHVAFVFKTRTRNVHLIKLRTLTAQPTLAPPPPSWDEFQG